MLNPIRLCYDLFDEKNLSDANLRAFAEDHITRVGNNNPGAIYSTLITNTTAKLTAYYGKMSSQLLQESIQESLTVAMNDAKQLVEDKIRSLHGLAVFKFTNTGASYQLLFPLGIDEYTKAKINEVTALYERLQTNVASVFTADFPAEVTAYAALVTNFKNARAAQTNVFSLVDTLITGKHEDRKALTEQLTFNFLTIAGNNIDNPDRFDDYFDPAFLPITEAPRTFNGIINANTTITAIPAGRITRSSNLTFENKGNNPLTFSISGTAATIDPIAQITLQPGQRLHYSENLPVFDRYFLNIQNNSPENGLWHAEVD